MTSFWHRRICEAIVVFCLLIIGLYLWSNSSGITADSKFYVSPLSAGISAAAIVIAALSYFVVPEKFRTTTTYAAYWILLFASASLNLTTGAGQSPFIAIWMIAVMFAGIFGRLTLGVLFMSLNVFIVLAILGGDVTRAAIINFVLAGELPLIVSYILWHGKSSSDKTKERAYYDLANELNQVSNKSEVVINAISDGVIAVNNKGEIELINPAAQRIVGWGHQDAVDLDYKSVLQLLTPDGHEVDKTSDPVFEVLTTNQPVRRVDLQLQTSSGKKLATEIVVSPIGRLGSGAIIVFRDITKELEEEKAQAEFISTASHEMRTPVASIEGYLGLALNPATATIDEKAREYIAKAHEAAQHLGRLFQDLLDVTKADDGRLSNNPKVLDMIAFTNNVVDALKQKAEQKGLRLFFKPLTDDENGMRSIDPVYYIDADADHLREVLSNLIENAIKYTPVGEVVIDVQGDDDHVVVSITDSGIGIPAEDIPHLFQKFYRVDNTDTREIGGTGLGLYLCRRLVEAMSGRIWVKSEYKKGSTFFVELPRISHAEAERLIEASNRDSIKPSVTMKYIQPEDEGGENGGDLPTKQQLDEALKTPIVVNGTQPVVVSPLSSTENPANPAQTETVVDSLVGSSGAAVAPSEPLQAHNGMVLPPSIQAVQSNVQTAPKPLAQQPQPAQAPAPQPVQPVPVAQPAPVRPIAVPKR